MGAAEAAANLLNDAGKVKSFLLVYVNVEDEVSIFSLGTSLELLGLGEVMALHCRKRAAELLTEMEDESAD